MEEKKPETVLDVAMTVTEESLRVSLYTAGAYSHYWARTDTYLSYALTHAKGVRVFDCENTAKCLGVLTREKLLAAPKRMAELVRADPERSRGIQKALGALLCGEALDGPQADLVVQIALFGEVVYG